LSDDAKGVDASPTGQDIVLKGTTLAIFRFIFKEGRPLGTREIQRGLKLSSASLASYHLAKLLEAGLIQETANGYIVNKRMFENVIRVRRTLIPAQVSYVAFFVTLAMLLLTILRPPVLYPAYYLSLVGILGAALVSIFEAKKAADWKF
jgi:predicted DNA-binding transcriptional regulator